MSILIVTGIEGARNCAAVVQAQLGMEVEVADGRKVALSALRRREFLAVAVDETMAATFLSSTSISMSPLSSRTMPNNFFTGSVVAPGLATLASTLQATVTSRSVAVNSTWPSSARSRIRWKGSAAWCGC